MGIGTYLRPFLSHMATSFGLFLVPILPYVNKLVSILQINKIVFAHTSDSESKTPFKLDKACK
jgi:hypothetical protein